jgi:hypothetical protein
MADSKAKLLTWRAGVIVLKAYYSGAFHEHQIIAASVSSCLDLYQPQCCCQKTSIHGKFAALGLRYSTAQIYFLS